MRTHCGDIEQGIVAAWRGSEGTPGPGLRVSEFVAYSHVIGYPPVSVLAIPDDLARPFYLSIRCNNTSRVVTYWETQLLRIIY